MRHDGPLALMILAAGQSKRMGAVNKLTMSVNDKPLLYHSLKACHDAACGSVYVITGHDRDIISQLAAPFDITAIHNADYRQGIGSSIACGISYLQHHYSDILIALGDTPFITSDMVINIVQSHLARPEHHRLVTRPVYGGHQGHPVIWGRDFFPKLAKLEGDKGGLSLIPQQALNLVAFHSKDPARDIDKPADIDEIKDVSDISSP